MPCTLPCSALASTSVTSARAGILGLEVLPRGSAWSFGCQVCWFDSRHLFLCELFYLAHETVFVFAAPKISEPIEGLRMHLWYLVSPASWK